MPEVAKQRTVTIEVVVDGGYWEGTTDSTIASELDKTVVYYVGLEGVIEIRTPH